MEPVFLSQEHWRALETDFITALEVANAEIPQWLVPTLLLSVRLTLNRALLDVLVDSQAAVSRDMALLPIKGSPETASAPGIKSIEDLLQAP